LFIGPVVLAVILAVWREWNAERRVLGSKGVMTMSTILRRTTFIVPDARAAAAFYESVFGWTRFYDHSLIAKRVFRPSVRMTSLSSSCY
jgi:hypothetical protein